MKITDRVRESLLKIIIASASRRRLRIVGASALTLVLTLNIFPAKTEVSFIHAPAAQTTSDLTFISEADAYVKQANPANNYGSAASLLVDEASNADVEAFLRFTVSGVSGTVQEARLRLYDTTNGSKNGPAVYASNASWAETEITWNNRPDRTSSAADNKAKISTSSWVEYDVTSLVSGDGTFSFVLAADGKDGVRFSAREGRHPPELVITLNSTENTPTPNTDETSTPALTETTPPNVTDTPGETPAPTLTASPAETFTFTPEPDTATPADTATLPASPTAPGSAVFVGAGDISTCSTNNDEATAKLLDTMPGTVFTTGDNAYTDGSYAQYTNCYDPTWGRHKARTKPVPGNHEYQTSGAAGYFQYFNHVPAYYAFNLGSWRIYALNSELSVTAASAQVSWLQDDLASNPSQCVLAYWHKPRWSSGSTHGSNSSMQALWQVLYSAGAELVINGHEHNYERFAEMNASGAAVSQGLREFVVGTGGNTLYSFGTILPATEVRNNSTYGVLKLTLRSGGYDWQFVPIAGSTFTDSGNGICH